ncbi:MAG: hypothetical protein A3B92_03005 [Candidatus Harrisonbacteria bacterium RIFCSPHIGHO2_02_FULL_42_16]|uniref:Uncharacterized protein n=1 Tax=Candidatus Harrisonbacteria bacterium RIFCSPHIGHO2_02_FULL_42_16 TaxID=1798404 RepID=A0A1G1ZI67_9BACT|nr:MAG: hypothetical protein A3B92_03005 [Candidatus Harrisonbacteria bacterium RIFCSPHIGHO2_02_FULL_42_16]
MKFLLSAMLFIKFISYSSDSAKPINFHLESGEIMLISCAELLSVEVNKEVPLQKTGLRIDKEGVAVLVSSKEEQEYWKRFFNHKEGMTRCSIM